MLVFRHLVEHPIGERPFDLLRRGGVVRELPVTLPAGREDAVERGVRVGAGVGLQVVRGCPCGLRALTLGQDLLLPRVLGLLLAIRGGLRLGPDAVQRGLLLEWWQRRQPIQASDRRP